MALLVGEMLDALGAGLPTASNTRTKALEEQVRGLDDQMQELREEEL